MAKKYLRLADHLNRGIRADINSGFSIAGLNVVEFPDKEEHPAAYAWCKAEVAAGRLEVCSKAEYDEVHHDVMEDLGIEVKRTVERKGMPNESAIQRSSNAKGRALRRSRSAEAGTDTFEADRKRRKRTIEAQRKGVDPDELDEAFDDEAGDDEDDAPVSKTAKRAAKAAREAEQVEEVDDDEDEDEADTADEDDEADESADDYSSWSPADLRSEIKERNEGRAPADKIKPEGTGKAALVAALEADDESDGE